MTAGYPELGPGQDPTRLAGPGGRFPARGWPAKGDLDYIKVAIEVLVLLLALPWLLRNLASHPGRTMKKASAHHAE